MARAGIARLRGTDVARQNDCLDRGVQYFERADHGGAVVGRAVVDDNHALRRGLLRQDVFDASVTTCARL